MNLTELYNAYKNEQSEPRKSTLKATYIFNGGKKLKIETNLELGIYKALCGNKLVNREIARYERVKNPNNRLQMVYRCEDLARIFVKSNIPEVFSKDMLVSVADNNNAIAVKIVGQSNITKREYKETYLVETTGNYPEYLAGLLWLNSKLAYTLLESMGYSDEIDIILGMANRFTWYLKR